MNANIVIKTYKCVHGRQCRSRCKDCLGRSVNQGKCSRCKKSFEADPSETFNGKPLQTCHDCRYKSNCPHGQRLKSKCEQCKKIVNAEKCEKRRLNKCEHDKRKDQCKDCDPNEFLKSKLRSYICRAVKQKKSQKSIEYLGCGIEEFKQHIEEQFKEGMTWENHGEWHIDHVTPLKYNNPTIEEVIERLHYSNTQPLWATDNMSKGNRFIG